MNKDKIERLASEILVAMYSRESTEPEDYKHNAIIAVRAASALSNVLIDKERPTISDQWKGQK